MNAEGGQISVDVDLRRKEVGDSEKVTNTHQVTTSDVTFIKMELPSLPQLNCQSLLIQMNQLGPSDRCTPSQAQAMGQQLLAIIGLHERTKMPLPVELQNSFDIFHRCLAVVYGTFFLNLYTKANAPCLLCHGCKCLYPPGQFIHHTCAALPPSIVPCRSRMWRRCLVPLVSPGVDKLHQKQRWKYVIEKFSHATTGGVRRNPIPPDAEAQLLEMPECKRGRFVIAPLVTNAQQQTGAMDQSGTLDQAGSLDQPGSLDQAGSLDQPGTMDQSGTVDQTGTLDQSGTIDQAGSLDQSGTLDQAGVVEQIQQTGVLGEAQGSLTPSPTQQMDSSHPQNLLDVEPVEFDGDDDSIEAPLRGPENSPPPLLYTQPQHKQHTSTLALAEHLVQEVKGMEQDLVHSKARLQIAEDMLRNMPCEAAMREQLAQALANQQVLKAERDQAVEQCRLAQDRANRLQHQLDRLRTAHAEMEKHFRL